MPRASKQYIDRTCEQCNGRNTELRRQVARNGVSQFFWHCLNCQNYAKRYQWIPHEVITGWMRSGLLKAASFDEIKITRDHTKDPELRCAVCGQPGVEFNHWAPQAWAERFGEDWHQWPGDYLCKYHHDLWHEIVTPHLTGRRRTKEAQATARHQETTW